MQTAPYGPLRGLLAGHAMWGPNVGSSQARHELSPSQECEPQAKDVGGAPLPRRIGRGVARPVGNKSPKALLSLSLSRDVASLALPDGPASAIPTARLSPPPMVTARKSAASSPQA
jgi:hypothetical protein